MKLTTLTLLLAFLGSALISCSPTSHKEDNDYQKSQFEVIVIDGCEYIYRFDGYHAGSTITHKGNCNNHKK